ncbi:DUF4055 domain-containing protein [Iningainema tapete]|uniref:DUF4055 domain-containing protein n=1 Tax=Iningainema tapete BLCC-T55 TaxID=2748662 RepID=A0A8J7C5S9_9CYAN|nr:DUF4055 domain-containing protein [Iningainema tapete]MBD2771151.1 DUF4055 domain-containing protein [Iningainema tapete BLCC-T55]
MSQEAKNLPLSLSHAAAAAVGKLKLLWDCWNDLEGVEKSYLPQETKEPPKAYADRIKRTTFDNRFEPAIKDYAGLLSVFSLNQDAAQSILDNKDNIDQQGNDIWSFFHEADQMVLRDGWCAILVEFPPDNPDIQSQADLLASDRHPYLVAIDRRDILNWRFAYVSGKPKLQRVTIQERRLEPDGEFGEVEQIYYRVLKPGEYAVYQIVEGSGGQNQLILVDSGTTSLSEIPLVCYSVTEGKLFSAKPPFLNLAKINIEHYQKRSQLNEVLRKCNLPVPVRRGLIRTADDLQKVPPLVIGPNSVIDIPENGDFFFAEPSGAAIAASREDIKDREAAMDRMTLDFLTSGKHQKTATEVVLDSTKTSANLKGVARRKESAAQQIFQLWVQYTGEPTGGSIAMDDSLLQMPLDPQATEKLESLAQTGFISQRTLLLLLQRGKVLPRQFDVDAEVAATEAAGNQIQIEEV